MKENSFVVAARTHHVSDRVMRARPPHSPGTVITSINRFLVVSSLQQATSKCQTVIYR